MSESSFLNPQKTLMAARLHEGMRVADLGAGSGFFARAAARLIGEGGVVWAVDVHGDLLPRLKNLALAEGLRNVEVVRGDIERDCRLPDASVDFIICANLLFQLEHKERALSEIARILRRGGRALLIDWRGSFGGLGPHPSHVVGEREVRALFEARGFSAAGEVPAGAYHWGLVVRKTAPKGAQ